MCAHTMQGIKRPDGSLLLTDPALHHSTDMALFGDTNIGYKGIQDFMNNHSCNSICKGLHLSNRGRGCVEKECVDSLAFCVIGLGQSSRAGTKW
jgi:hypothetical protein